MKINEQLLMNLQLFGEGGTETSETAEPDLTVLQNTVLDLQAQIKTLTENNAKLTQHNQELFLRVTGEEKTTEQKDNLKQYKDYVGEDFFNSLSNKQQKLLITILEGEDE